MHAALGIGVVAGDVPCNGGLGALGGLLEGHGALDVGVSAENGDWSDDMSVLLSVDIMQLNEWMMTARVVEDQQLAIKVHVPHGRCPGLTQPH
jgi:hypothetical protein